MFLIHSSGRNQQCPLLVWIICILETLHYAVPPGRDQERLNENNGIKECAPISFSPWSHLSNARVPLSDQRLGSLIHSCTSPPPPVHVQRRTKVGSVTDVLLVARCF